MLKKSVFSIVVTVMFLALSFPAFAIPVPPVASWDYIVTSEFLIADTVFSSGEGTTSATSTKLSWGTSDNDAKRSSLVLKGDDPADSPATITDVVTTYTGASPLPPESFWAQDISITHNNRSIAGNSSVLQETKLFSTVKIAPETSGAWLPIQEFDFGIKFYETPNTKYKTDIFALIGGLPDLDFSYSGINYYVNLFPIETVDGFLSTLSKADVDMMNSYLDVDIPYGTVGFTTLEDQDTTVEFRFTISTAPYHVVPEPATILLLGCGLFGLGVYTRRRRIKL